MGGFNIDGDGDDNGFGMEFMISDDVDDDDDDDSFDLSLIDDIGFDSTLNTNMNGSRSSSSKQ